MFRAFYIEHHLFSHISLFHLLLIYYLAIGLYDEPSTGARTLVIARAYDKRHLVVFLLQPKVGPALVCPYECLVKAELESCCVFYTINTDFFACLTSNIYFTVAFGDSSNPAAVTNIVRP